MKTPRRVLRLPRHKPHASELRVCVALPFLGENLPVCSPGVFVLYLLTETEPIMSSWQEEEVLYHHFSLGFPPAAGPASPPAQMETEFDSQARRMQRTGFPAGGSEGSQPRPEEGQPRHGEVGRPQGVLLTFTT